MALYHRRRPHLTDRASRQDRIEPRRLIAFVAMVFGMFMAILDVQIVSASLTEIQAGLSASSNEISWVQTAYLIAEVVMIPLSGFLSRALGTRILFAISAAGFTAAMTSELRAVSTKPTPRTVAAARARAAARTYPPTPSAKGEKAR